MIVGRWYASGGAEAVAATLYVMDDIVELRVADNILLSCHLNDVEVSDRLGNVERKLIFNTIGIFTTADNQAIDHYFSATGLLNRIIHTLETNMIAVVAAIVLTVAVAISFLKWGVPWVSEVVAHALPHKVNELIAEETLGFLDNYWFEESELSEERQAAIRQHFHSQLIPLDARNEGISYHLHFRSWHRDGKAIPNAFALPSGDIIVTDQFIRLTDSQDEIDAVLLHEIGHVIERHGLEMVVQGTLVTTLIMLVSGDSSGIADLGLGLGAVLVSSHYSREYELEADTYAFEKMLEMNKDPIAFSVIMGKMEDYVADVFTASAADVSDDNAEGSKDGDTKINDKNQSSEQHTVSIDDAPHDQKKETSASEEDLMDYLSTHPRTQDRQENAERYSECFRQGLLTCEAL